MTIPKWFTARIRSYFEKSVRCVARRLLAHEADCADSLVVASALSPAAQRALEYDAYMRNNRSANGLPS